MACSLGLKTTLQSTIRKQQPLQIQKSFSSYKGNVNVAPLISYQNSKKCLALFYNCLANNIALTIDYLNSYRRQRPVPSLQLKRRQLRNCAYRSCRRSRTWRSHGKRSVSSAWCWLSTVIVSCTLCLCMFYPKNFGFRKHKDINLAFNNIYLKHSLLYV